MKSSNPPPQTNPAPLPPPSLTELAVILSHAFPEASVVSGDTVAVLRLPSGFLCRLVRLSYFDGAVKIRLDDAGNGKTRFLVALPYELCTEDFRRGLKRLLQQRNHVMAEFMGGHGCDLVAYTQAAWHGRPDPANRLIPDPFAQ